jgi:hypothetical protein
MSFEPHGTNKRARPLERVRQFFANDGEPQHRTRALWWLDGLTVFTDNALLLGMFGSVGAPEPWPGEHAAVAARLLRRAAELSGGRIPPEWPSEWMHQELCDFLKGTFVRAGGLCYQARYVTACRYVLGEETTYCPAEIEHAGGRGRAMLLASPIGGAVILHANIVHESAVRWDWDVALEGHGGGVTP